MFSYNEYTPTANPELVEQLAQFSTPILADAINLVGSDRNGVLGGRLHSLQAGLKFHGTAITVNATDGNFFAIQYALYKGYPGAVLCIATEGHNKSAYLGEMMACTAQGFGYVAVVIDGLIRDAAELRAMNYPVFAAGTHPRAYSPTPDGEINVKIQLDSVAVFPGDIIIGDDNGIVVIAPELAEAVLSSALKKAAGDDARLNNIRKYFMLPEEERNIYSTMSAKFAESYKKL